MADEYDIQFDGVLTPEDERIEAMAGDAFARAYPLKQIDPAILALITQIITAIMAQCSQKQVANRLSALRFGLGWNLITRNVHKMLMRGGVSDRGERNHIIMGMVDMGWENIHKPETADLFGEIQSRAARPF